MAKKGQHQVVPDGNSFATTTDIGLTRKGIYEARQIRNADRAVPGHRADGEILID